MSRDDPVLTLDEGTTEQLPGRLRNETNSGSGNFQRSGNVIQRIVKRNRKVKKSFCSCALVAFSKKNGEVIICMLGLISDALTIYLLGIDESVFTFDYGKGVATAAIVLLWVFDIYHIFFLRLSHDLEKSSRRNFLWYLVDFLCFLPIPQVLLTLNFKCDLHLFLWIMLYVFLLLKHVRKSIPVILWSKKALTSGDFADCSLMFLFSCLYPAQLYGALWYILVVYRTFQCGIEGCRNQQPTATLGECIDYILYAHHHCFDIDSQKILDFCDKDYHYGMVAEALNSGLVRTDVSSWKKIFYCFRQGLQHLSSFGQNLQAGMDVAGNFYAIGVCIFGTLSFSLLIGFIQIIQQSIIINRLQAEKKLKEIKLLKHIPNLSKDLLLKVIEYKQEDWREPSLENIFNNLSKELRRELTRELCLELLKKVEEFEGWSRPSLLELCDRLKPIFFVASSRIIQEGNPVDEIIFVVQGKLWTYTKFGSSSTTNYNQSTKIEYLKDGDFLGKELVNWIQANLYTSNLPISSVTIQAVTDVEAFVLMAYDLKEILINHREGVVSIE